MTSSRGALCPAKPPQARPPQKCCSLPCSKSRPSNRGIHQLRLGDRFRLTPCLTTYSVSPPSSRTATTCSVCPEASQGSTSARLDPATGTTHPTQFQSDRPRGTNPTDALRLAHHVVPASCPLPLPALLEACSRLGGSSTPLARPSHLHSLPFRSQPEHYRAQTAEGAVEGDREAAGYVEAPRSLCTSHCTRRIQVREKPTGPNTRPPPTIKILDINSGWVDSGGYRVHNGAVVQGSQWKTKQLQPCVSATLRDVICGVVCLRRMGRTGELTRDTRPYLDSAGKPRTWTGSIARFRHNMVAARSPRYKGFGSAEGRCPQVSSQNLAWLGLASPGNYQT